MGMPLRSRSIRDSPGLYFADEEVIAIASERAPLMTVFNKKASDVEEIKPGTILVAKASGELEIERFADDPARETGCSFERIYFSREMILIFIRSVKCLDLSCSICFKIGGK